MENISLAELRSLLQSDAPILFEALSEKYFAAGHLPGAFMLPLDRIAQIADSSTFDKERAVVVYCASATCQNSHIAAEKLGALGYRSVRVFGGGKAEWKEAGLPLVVSQ